MKFATSLGRCLVTHNRVDFEVEGRSGFPTMPNRLVERLHLQYINENRQHSGIIIVPQKNAYEIARRIGVLVSAFTVEEINNQLLYA